MAMAICSISPVESGVLLPVPLDHQCCLSTEEEWPSLLGAAVRMWYSFHGLFHQELQGLRLQDYFVVKLLRYKKIRMRDLYYQRTKAPRQSCGFCQPPLMPSFLCLPYATTFKNKKTKHGALNLWGVGLSLEWGYEERVWQGLKNSSSCSRNHQ